MSFMTSGNCCKLWWQHPQHRSRSRGDHAEARHAVVQAYGMATWDCFRKAPDAGGLQLQEIVKLARAVGGRDHGFR